jgi:hypothetical protein
MVVESVLKVFGYRLIPATTWSHGCLGRLPPLLSFACAELVVNVEELGCHGEVAIRHILG